MTAHTVPSMTAPSESKPVTIKQEPLPRIDSATLLRERSSVLIEHASQCYILRVTRENKLILTK